MLPAIVTLAVLLVGGAVWVWYWWGEWETNYQRQLKDKDTIIEGMQESILKHYHANANLRMSLAAHEAAELAEEAQVVSKTSMTPGRALAKQRANHARKIQRLLTRYETPDVTDDIIKEVLEGLLSWLKGDTARYNKRKGGLGK